MDGVSLPVRGGSASILRSSAKLGQLAQLPLDPRQFRGHDRDVDDQQDDEDDVGAGDVLAGLVERQRRGLGQQQASTQLTSGAIRELAPERPARRARGAGA